MEEIEVPIEKAQEEIHEHALQHGGRFMSYAAIQSALLAVFAAISALMAGQHANDAVMSQIKAANQWNYYQAKGVKTSVLETRRQILESLGKEVPESVSEKLAEYQKEQKEIQEKARESEAESSAELHRHEVFAKAVTFFQVAIAISAIAVLTRKRPLLFVSLSLGLAGILFFVMGWRI